MGCLDVHGPSSCLPKWLFRNLAEESYRRVDGHGGLSGYETCNTVNGIGQPAIDNRCGRQYLLCASYEL